MRKHEPFRFKQFVVSHDRCAMKVGTDAVLLGAWTNVSGANRILDVGTGSGIIALMLAQRTGEKVSIDALEIESEDFSQASENVLSSPWAKRISVYMERVQTFDSDTKYDLIVSNPPYFTKSLKPPAQNRTHARHAVQLSPQELVNHSIRLLNPTGTLAVILPFHEGNYFKSIALEKGLHLNRAMALYSKKEKPQERWLFEFGITPKPTEKEKLILHDEIGVKSKAYLQLTSDFYL